jgi:hypothetical protein
MDFDLSDAPADRRWIVLFEEDHDNVALDTDGNLAVLVDIEQTGELIRLGAESLAALSSRDAEGDDVIADMIAALEEVRDE